MAETSIPVDLFNPGQVFACIGIVEAADILLGGAEGAFDWSQPHDPRFHVRAQGSVSPVEEVLGFLERARAVAELPEGSTALEQWLAAWGDPQPVDRRSGYPYPAPASPATAVCRLTDGVTSIVVDHWGDATRRDNVKFWAGARGYPGAALARDALELIRGRTADAIEDPFSLGLPQSSSFRLDWRRDYIAIDAGFSLNEHSHIVTVGFPLVEMLGAIGLSHARPLRPSWRDKLQYCYATAGRAASDDDLWLPLPLLRCSLGGAETPFPTRRFRMSLGWPGKEGQARAITTVTEEATP